MSRSTKDQDYPNNAVAGSAASAATTGTEVVSGSVPSASYNRCSFSICSHFE